MEIASITAALSGIKCATDIAKAIKESGATLEAAEIKYKLAELIDALADAKIELANTKELVLEKDLEIKSLKSNSDRKVTWEEPYYFSINDNGVKEGPFCQRCHDKEKLLIRIQSPNKNGFWQCLECKSTYQDSKFHEDSSPIVGVVRSFNLDDY